LANGGRSTIDYIIGSPTIWQAVTHLEVIIDDTRYYTMGGDSDHRPLCLRLNIDCTSIEPQHIIVTKKFLPRFKYALLHIVPFCEGPNQKSEGFAKEN
jgi:hypothetical protein